MSLFAKLKLLAGCDLNIDGLEAGLWEYTWYYERNNDGERRRLLHDPSFNPPQKISRDTKLWERNQISRELGLPDRSPHDWAPRGYAVNSGGCFVYEG